MGDSGEQGGGSEPLKTATAIVGLLAGIITGVYLLGGVVIALRLLFDDFGFESVVTILGQLPREPVIATALVDVVGPALTVGLVMAMYYGLRNHPRSREWRSDALDEGFGHLFLLLVLFPFIAAVGCLPALYKVVVVDQEAGPLLVTSLIGILVTYGVIAAGWFLKRRVGRSGWQRLPRAAAAGAIWAVIALIPAAMFASALDFDRAQVCVEGSQAPEKGRLVGVGNSRLLLEQRFGNEAEMVSLPVDRVTRSEHGDLSSTFGCPLPPGQKALAKVAEAKLDGHGGERELGLATQVRPYLFFDSRERWRPVAVESFLGERFGDGDGHRFCPRGDGPCRPARGIGGLRADGGPAYIDIHKGNGDYRAPRGECPKQKPPAADCNGGPRAVIYYRRTTHEGRWYWDYWWFLRYNEYTGPFRECSSRFCSNHEGDWEGVTVITTPLPRMEVVGALYAAHSDRVLVEGDELPLSGRHVLAFVAEGTHASYPYRCAEDCEQYATIAGARLPEDPHDGAVAWGGNRGCAGDGCVEALPESSRAGQLALPQAGGWASWPGLWGETCHAGCDGLAREVQASPRSPGLQVRFKCPWAATRWALPANDDSGLSKSEPAGDAERLRAVCAAQRGGL